VTLPFFFLFSPPSFLFPFPACSSPAMDNCNYFKFLNYIILQRKTENAGRPLSPPPLPLLLPSVGHFNYQKNEGNKNLMALFFFFFFSFFPSSFSFFFFSPGVAKRVHDSDRKAKDEVRAPFFPPFFFCSFPFYGRGHSRGR